MPVKQRRIAVMGYRSVGKSSLTIQFVENHFVDVYNPTIENTFTKNVKIRGQEYALELIDTAGRDEDSMVSDAHLMNIDGYVLVYSVTSSHSLEVVSIIHDRLLDMRSAQKLPTVLVGNKTDLRNERKITEAEGRSKANNWNAVFVEASAKENQKVADIFQSCIMEIEKADENVPKESNCVLS